MIVGSLRNSDREKVSLKRWRLKEKNTEVRSEGGEREGEKRGEKREERTV